MLVNFGWCCLQLNPYEIIGMFHYPKSTAVLQVPQTKQARQMERHFDYKP